MDSFIRELYYGRIRPSTKYFEMNSKIEKIMVALVENEERLTESLDEKQEQIFSEYARVWSDLLGIEVCETFVIGFRLGAALTMDTFVNKDNEFKSTTEGD